MKGDLLVQAISGGRAAAGDYFTKRDWKREGTKTLRQLAKDLGLAKGTYDVRFCEGGHAVTGECILHSDSLYVCLTPRLDDAGFARSVTSRKDYVGGMNHSIPVSYEGLLNLCQRLNQETAFQVVA